MRKMDQIAQMRQMVGISVTQPTSKSQMEEIKLIKMIDSIVFKRVYEKDC